MKAKLSYKEQAENFILWTHKLATTRLKQGAGYLGNSRSGFCCLGVACHMFDVDYSPENSFDEAVVDLMGLLDETGSSCKPEEEQIILEYSSLSGLNDEGFAVWSSPSWEIDRYTFPKISNHLIKYYKNYLNPKVATQVTKLLKAAGGRV